jgi:hypothetical protein
VTLEDSGELAVAGDYLGVPHPPGYPDLDDDAPGCFARVFSWVTFRGQPTPAWSIALGSAVFGALAAGITAMLITRSSARTCSARTARIRLHNIRDEPRGALLCWAGGVAGSLIFAFSPVMWSQATIVEVYALGAFFLMLVMLLTYRWMRRPTRPAALADGLRLRSGLTNYQVLLLAALPLVVVIFLRDIALFRDFLLTLIPILLTAVGAETGFALAHRSRASASTSCRRASSSIRATGSAWRGWRFSGRRCCWRSSCRRGGVSTAPPAPARGRRRRPCSAVVSPRGVCCFSCRLPPVPGGRPCRPERRWSSRRIYVRVATRSCWRAGRCVLGGPASSRATGAIRRCGVAGDGALRR